MSLFEYLPILSLLSLFLFPSEVVSIFMVYSLFFIAAIAKFVRNNVVHVPGSTLLVSEQKDLYKANGKNKYCTWPLKKPLANFMNTHLSLYSKLYKPCLYSKPYEHKLQSL